MKVVITAGGKGTRIAQLNALIPKPMFEINGKPILEHQIEVLASQGYQDIYITVGYLGDCIRNYFENGAKWGTNIRYINEDSPLGTAGALFYLKDELSSEDAFLLINGDIIFDIDIKKFENFHFERPSLATIITHPNDHPFDSGVIKCDKDGLVKKWFHKEEERTWYQNLVNAGIHILSTKLLKTELFGEVNKVDLDRDVLKPLIAQDALYAYRTSEYIKDMGTPKRYGQVEADIMSGKVYNRNLSHKQKAIFVDRDGTINEYVGFLRNIDEFKLIPNAAEAIGDINKSDYLCIVITNQPVVARGEVTEEELQQIHDKMETLLGEKGAYIDGLYYCPHHPDRGFEGEKIEYKIVCECRKPKPGLLMKAAKDFNIDLSQSWMIGDSLSDVRTGIAAGCRTGLISEEHNEEADVVDSSLLNIVKRIL